MHINNKFECRITESLKMAQFNRNVFQGQLDQAQDIASRMQATAWVSYYDGEIAAYTTALQIAKEIVIGIV
jgi:hypothetical protein